MEVAPGVHHFTTGLFNWYIVEEEGRLTVVDAGFPWHYRAFLQGIRSLGYSVSDVEAIVLTHAHADHMGFVERLRAQTGVPVYVHREDQQAAEQRLQLPWISLFSNAWRPHIARMLTHAIFNGVFSSPRIRRSVAIEDGAELPVPGRPVVIHVPGHTPGEMALFLPDRKVLLSGDTLITCNLLTGADVPPQVPPNVLNGDTQQAIEALSPFRDLGNVTLLSGHGKPWQGEMAEAVESVQQRKNVNDLL